MKKGFKIFICILLILVVAVGVILYTQWNSIEAFLDAVRYTNEDVSKNLLETKNNLQELLDNEEDITVRDLTEEESQALIKGDLNEEEVIAIITGKDPAEIEKENPPTESKEPTVPDEEQESTDIISELIAKLYVQKSTYLNKLDVIEEEARAEYLSLKGTERKERKEHMLPKYLPIVASWERECDSMVYGAIDEIRAELKKLGRDESIADNLKSAYLEEKRAKKAYFINRYMD